MAWLEAVGGGRETARGGQPWRGNGAAAPERERAKERVRMGMRGLWGAYSCGLPGKRRTEAGLRCESAVARPDSHDGGSRSTERPKEWQGNKGEAVGVF